MTTAASTYHIIGSGLTGLSVAYALLSAGKKVVMLDGGTTLEKSTNNHAQTLAQKPAWQWTEDEKAFFTNGVESSTSGVKEKKLFGSNFSSRPAASQPFEKRNSAFYSSVAQNGLGNIWGAGLMPMHENDMHDWPIAYRDLTEHYKAVLNFMPLSGQNDALEQDFPLFNKPNRHPLSRQTRTLLARAEKHKEKLGAHGFQIGASRLAASFDGGTGAFECQNCGMCMYGCPYGVLYTGSSTFAEFLQHKNFSYLPNVIVQKIERDGTQKTIHVTDHNGSHLPSIPAKSVFVATGPFATTRIMLRSLGLYDRPVIVKTSEQFYMPMLSLQGFSNIDQEDKHTMCQSFMELLSPEVSPFFVHFSIYGHNDLYRKAIKNLLSPIFPLVDPFVNIALSRLYFMFCYLHSDHSPTIVAQLENTTKKALILQGVPNAEAGKTLKKIKKSLRSVAPQLGLLSVPLYKGQRLPGAANHSGGSFPMSTSPSMLETDLLGQIPGFDGVHIVDSSVFPSITATTMTYSVMANAHRIATLVSKQ